MRTAALKTTVAAIAAVVMLTSSSAFAQDPIVPFFNRPVPVLVYPVNPFESFVARNRLVAQTAAVNPIVSVTPTVDTTYFVSGNVLITASTTFSFTMNAVYTDEGNTGRTVSVPFVAASGFATGAAAITNASGAAPYEGMKTQIRVKGGTTLTLATAGTFTSVTYNVEAIITQCLVCP